MTQTALPLERTPAATRAIRGPLVTFVGDPFQHGLGETMRYEADAIVAIEQRRITQVGAATKVRRVLPPSTEVERYGNDSLIMAGFIDCHVHFPQIPIIGAGGAPLLDWLEKYTFVAEQRFEQPKHSRDVARVFLRESLRNGVTTARTVSPLAL